MALTLKNMPHPWRKGVLGTFDSGRGKDRWQYYHLAGRWDRERKIYQLVSRPALKFVRRSQLLESDPFSRRRQHYPYALLKAVIPSTSLLSYEGWQRLRGDGHL